MGPGTGFTFVTSRRDFEAIATSIGIATRVTRTGIFVKNATMTTVRFTPAGPESTFAGGSIMIAAAISDMSGVRNVAKNAMTVAANVAMTGTSIAMSAAKSAMTVAANVAMTGTNIAMSAVKNAMTVAARTVKNARNTRTIEKSMTTTGGDTNGVSATAA